MARFTMVICIVEFGGRGYAAGKVDMSIVLPRLWLAMLCQQKRLLLVLVLVVRPCFVVLVAQPAVLTLVLIFIVEFILVEVPVVGQPPPLSWGNVDRRTASRSSKPRTAERYAVDQVLAAAGDLVSSTDAAFLQVIRQERSDTAIRQSVQDSGLGIRRPTGNIAVQDFIVLFEDAGDRLEVQTLEGVAILGMKLNGVVVEAPVVALEGYGLVDELDELRDGWVIVQEYVEENPGFW